MQGDFPPPADQGAVEVAGGRRVGYARWGIEGPVVLSFHGSPGSRYLALGPEVADSLGVRLISLERPGFGRSDFSADRTIGSWAADVAKVADHFSIAEFAVVGTSAGGPYALACAAHLHERVARTGVVAGVLPPQFYDSDPLIDLAATDRSEAERAVRAHYAQLARDIDGSVDQLGAADGPDAAIYRRPAVQELFRQARTEAFRQGIDAAVLDLLLANSPWDFRLEDISSPVLFWHGEVDPITPLDVILRACATMPAAHARVFPGEGHAIGFAHASEILDELTAPWR